MSTRTEWIRHPGRLLEIANAWDLLAENDPAPFSRLAWLSAWWRAFGRADELRVCVIWDGDRLVAGLPLRADRGLRSLANDHTPTYRALLHDPDSAALLSRALIHTGHTVRLDALPAAEPETRALIDGLGDGRSRAVLEPAYASPITVTRGPFEAYASAHSTQWREIERRWRKLRREHEVSLAPVISTPNLERDLAEGLALEASGWKGRNGTAVLSQPSTAQFYREMARAFEARGELAVSRLDVNGRLAAFDLALLHRGRYYLLKTAYDESLRTYGPGLALRRGVLKRCFELDLDAHEFLGIDMEWKRLFATGRRDHYTWHSYPQAVHQVPRYAYRRHARSRLRSVYRKLRRPRS